MCGNNGCFGGNIWWIIILLLIFGCGNGCGNGCGCNNDNNCGGCGCGCNYTNQGPSREGPEFFL